MSVIIEEQFSSPLTQLVEAHHLPASIAQVLLGRGVTTSEQADHFLNPSLDRLVSPHAFDQMQIAVDRLLVAIRAEEPIAIYADRDVDGLTGLAILTRSLRTLGAQVVWGSPVQGRGVERAVLERLVQSGAKVMVLVDCGTGEHAELDWLAAQGIDVIVADHHRFTESKPVALAWIHPGVLADTGGAAPAGCVMAFKLAHALWLSFLGDQDPERLDYFLFGHLDLVSLGILADRMPLVGENRIFVWHGLRRLAYSRKTGLAALTRFFRLTPRSVPMTVREACWQIIPILNAAGRLGRPEITAELLLAEDSDVARGCIDQMLKLNSQRRAAQDESLISFEKAVLEQCLVETDSVLMALAQDLEPAVTGLAAQALVRKYGKPTFLFVSRGAECVGSGRGLPGLDLFAWVETHQEFLIKYGGHQGAVGLTIRTDDFAVFRKRLMRTAGDALAALDPALIAADPSEIGTRSESRVTLEELNEFWWLSLDRLGPFGTGHPMPQFEITDIAAIEPVKRKRAKNPPQEFVLKTAGAEVKARLDPDAASLRAQQAVATMGSDVAAGPWTVTGYPIRAKGGAQKFDWIIRDLQRS